MNKIRTILLALLLSVATTPLMADFTGPYVGVTLAANGAEFDGKHTDEDGAITKGTAGQVFNIAGLDAGWTFGLGDSFGLSLGITNMGGDGTIKADDAADNADVDLKISGPRTIYISPTIAVSDTSAIYLKLGKQDADFTATGDVTGAPGDLSGKTVAIGTQSIFPSGMFIQTEAGVQDYDEFTITGIGGSSSAVLKATPKIAYGSVTLGIKF
jgi:hypothetical protein